MLFHLLSSKECTCNAMRAIFYKHLSATDHHSRYDHLFWRIFSHLNHAISSSPLLHLEKFRGFQVVHDRNLHPTLPFPNSSSMDSYPNTSMEDLSNTEVIHLSHKFPFKWPVNFPMRTDPARNLETPHAPKKSTTIGCLSSAIFAALTFSVSLPSFSASSSARTCLVFELSGKDCSVISHNC